MDNKEMREKFELWAKENYELLGFHKDKIEEMFDVYLESYAYSCVDFAYNLFKLGILNITENNQQKESSDPVWTWEDKNNKILPEVGTQVVGKTTKTVYEVVKKNKYGLAIASTNEEYRIKVGSYTKGEFLSYFNPLETPQQKYDRERREFVLSIKVPGYVWKDGVSDFKAGLSVAYEKLKPFQEDEKTQE